MVTEGSKDQRLELEIPSSELLFATAMLYKLNL